ncbi:sensor domain-containing diguanylate cyclase [Vibrio cortegadensis]|uniref:sensor domain-containing diguanylate cyclase n=1 Tax=Vibrio cortegadensis TaxID=1328770 RepID=UPI0021C49F59|nr:sensor domain-containing diguanylate cyclase [Vibrio cortegadensis]MDN3698282.1 sensor domain-containing diguanylate cyclase [Vibrio cortegadensis]
MSSRNNIFSLSKLSSSTIVFILAMSVTLVCVFVSYKAQTFYRLASFNDAAERHVQSLQFVVKNDIQHIAASAIFFSANDRSDWDKFSIFAKHTIANSESLIGLQWMEKVEVDDIEKHIDRVGKTFPGFGIYTIPKDGDVTHGYILEDNAPIYVATDIYPRTRENARLLGFYPSRKRFELILDGISQAGEPNISDKVRLIQDSFDKSAPKNGMLVYFPVFEIGTFDLLGVVIGVIRTTPYFEHLVHRIDSDNGLKIRVTDVGFESEDAPIMYESKSWDPAEDNVIRKSIPLYNREWVVEFQLPSKITISDAVVLVGIFFGGLTISLLLAHIGSLQSRERERLSMMLKERTKELQFLVEHDSLTGLLNRRAFNRYIKKMLKRKESFSLVSFDIDHFKSINDQHGHVCGDEMLIHVSDTVTSELHSGDCFYRVGGDEFSIICQLTDEKELKNYLDSIRRAVESSVLYFPGIEISCTISIGAARYAGEGLEDILHKADRQLYHSKENGRNCISVAA